MNHLHDDHEINTEKLRAYQELLSVLCSRFMMIGTVLSCRGPRDIAIEELIAIASTSVVDINTVLQ
jgi:hypothetical protein